MKAQKEIVTEYEQQAEAFLNKHRITFKSVYSHNGFHFSDDKEKRDIYKLTLSRDSKKDFTVIFGQSIAKSKNDNVKRQLNDRKAFGLSLDNRQYKIEAPTVYDLLSCLTKNDPWDFESFCSEFGYDTDSIKAKTTYDAVLKEWYQVRCFFTESELEELQEIN